MKVFFFISVFLSINFFVVAQENFKVDQVTVFKNGIALIEKSATLNVNGKVAIINDIPFNNLNPSAHGILIGTVQFRSKTNEIIETRIHSNYIKLVFAKESKKENVILTYVQSGLTWIPTYLIRMNNKRDASLKLNVTVLNELEDLENVDINFAIGSPYFPYSMVNSPLVYTNSIANVQYSIDNQKRNYARNNFNEVVVVGYGTAKASKKEQGGNSLNLEHKPVVGEEFFSYPKKNFSLAKNERVKLDILKAKIDYSDIYRVTIATSKTKVRHRNFKNALSNPSNIVWHSIKFKNNSNFPLIGGVAHIQGVINNKINFISQGKVNYTNIDDSCEFKISIAPDIVVVDSDKEFKREEVSGDFELTIQAKITVNNFKRQPVDLEITREIIGVLSDSDKDWMVTKYPENNFRTNETNHVIWKLKVPSGSEEEINYSYKILVD